VLLQGTELKVIADQLGHSSVVLTADTYLSVAVELGLKSAAAAARLTLSHAGRPPGGGTPGAPAHDHRKGLVPRGLTLVPRTRT
jgi:hypothetical protein